MPDKPKQPADKAPAEKQSAETTALIDSLVGLGINKAAVLALLKQVGAQVLQLLLQLLQPPAPTPPQAKAACCDHGKCCCAISAHLARAIEAGCCHLDADCCHEDCCRKVTDEVAQALVLAVAHQRQCCD